MTMSPQGLRSALSCSVAETRLSPPKARLESPIALTAKPVALSRGGPGSARIGSLSVPATS